MICRRKCTLMVLTIFCLLNNQVYAEKADYNGIQVIESNQSYFIIQFNIDSLNIQMKSLNQKSYYLTNIPGFDFTAEPGKPQLPTRGLFLAIPSSGEVRLEILQSDIETKNDMIILPAVEQILSEDSQEEASFVIDEKFYKQDIWYPESVVKISDPGFIRDQRIVPVQISPLQYNPNQKTLRIHRSLTFRLNFESVENQITSSQKPSSPIFENSLQKLLLNYDSGTKWRKTKSSSQMLLKPSNWLTTVSTWYKIYVKEDGIYRIGKDDLDSAGVSINEIDPRTIKIFNLGYELPIFVSGQQDGRFDDEDYIEFYGKFNRGENSYLSPYSISNVYWLTWNATVGLRMAEVDAGLYEKESADLIQPHSYHFSMHLEKDWIFDRLLMVDDETIDHWFWERMDAHRTYEFKFSLNNPMPDESVAKVKAMLFGSTHPSTNPDHHTIIKINGKLIEDSMWDGQEEHFCEASNLPNRILKGGENILSIELPGDSPAGEVDQLFLNWFEITYRRSFQAVDDFIEFQVDQSQKLHQFAIHGFSGNKVHIIDNHGRRLNNFEVIEEGSTYTIVFQDNPFVTPTIYYGFTSNAVKKVEKISADFPSNLKSIQNGADYILITHEQFKNSITSLADHRASQGLRVQTVDVQDIYDEFNFGILDPRAIQQFLKYAYENWAPPAPLYVMLVGDANWAYNKEAARNWKTVCYVPSIMKYTDSWGISSSDNALACVSGEDRLPDMFIGRLPVNSIEGAETVINKIIQYETQPNFGDWRKKICLACGNGQFFENSADVLYNEYIPRAFDVPRIYTNPKSKYFGSTQDMVDIFNNGVSLLNFIGHGGGGVFFDAELFLLDDIVRLNNSDKLPIMFSLTCFIGYFDDPSKSSLGEELLRANAKGVIATFGSAGRAWMYGDYLLNNALFQSLFIYKKRNLGQVTTEAKWQMIARSNNYWDHVENYNLLGDPALKIGFPDKEVSLQLSNASLAAGDAMTLQGTIPDQLTGKTHLTVLDSGESLVTDTLLSVIAGKFQAHLKLPQNIKAGQGVLKSYFWNNKIDGTGSSYFSIQQPCFSKICTAPQKPGHLDSTYIFVRIDISSQSALMRIDSVFCTFSSNGYFWKTIPMISQGNNDYKTKNPIAAREGTKVSYKISVILKQQNMPNPVTVESNEYAYNIKKRAELMLASPGLVITGQEQVIVQLNIKNPGESDAEGFMVEVYDGNPSSGGILIGNAATVQLLKANKDTVLDIPWHGEPWGYHKIYIQIDPKNQIDEINEFNNYISKEINLLTVNKGSGGIVFSADSSFAMDIPRMAVTSNSFLNITSESPSEINQGHPFPQKSTLVPSVNKNEQFFQVEFGDQAIEITKPYIIYFYYDKSINLKNSTKIFAWEEESHQWIYQNSHVDSSACKIHAEVKKKASLFGLFRTSDDSPPKITIEVQDQAFSNGDYISPQPMISAVLEDESGIDLKSNPVLIKLDNQLVDTLELKYSRSPDSNNMVLLNYDPSLQPGEHVFQIEIYDIVGNKGQASINFNVSDGFELLTIANHPNPFTDETIIAYTLSDQAEQVTIRVYTAAGRLIRSFDYAGEMGYLEHDWDGRDEFGNEVANGVYYLKFEAIKATERIKTIEKMAKLK